MPSGIYTRSVKARKSLSEAAKKRDFSYLHTPENRAKRGAALKNRTMSQEWREKLSKSHKGQAAWNKGLVGLVGLNKGKKIEKLAGSNNANWKGDGVGYSALHSWLRRYLGQPTTCWHCGAGNLKGQKIHWANKSGEYKRNPSDWLRLCSSCHKKYDLNREK